jgi:FKBP-type peptidyl-prolyl cis-trans isomerase
MPVRFNSLMNKKLVSFTAFLAFGAFASQAAEIKSADDLKDPRQKASYGLGVNAGNLWKGRGADIDWDAYIKGVRDAYGGGTLLLTDPQIREAMTAFQAETTSRFQAKQAEEGGKNKAAGDKFLADNKAKEGVKTTASGLQYKVVKQGEGTKPAATDKVTVHYTGTLIDGKKFDSSIDRGQPATFPLNGVIKGWTEGLQLMPAGSKYQFFIPPDLAYGLNAPPSIGPNQVLIFDVELISVEASQPPQPAQPVTSDIIKVPSAEELAKGAKIEVIKAEDAKKLAEEQKAKPADKK